MSRGDLYERAIFNELLSSKLTKRSYLPAGSDKNKPDAVFLVNDKKYNLEIKLDLDADFGQGTLRYDFNNFKWISYAENPKMMELMDYYEIEKIANDKWKKVPNRVGKNDIGRKPRTLTPKEIAEDKKNFPDVYVNLTGRNPIAEYYNSKDTYYIQIGKLHGFYFMGSDPLNLGVPEFNPSQQKIRIRLKTSGNTYRFSTALVVSKNIKKSNYDLDINTNFLVNAGR